MSSSNSFKSDLWDIYNIVQGSMIVYPKEVIIATLRDFFSKDSYYHYSRDQWGFSNTKDHTDLPLGADIPVGHSGSTAITNTLLSTRLFIGENYHQNGIFYPAILVKSGGSKYIPISINREKGGIQYEDMIFEDGYSNRKVISKPTHFITAGVWEGSIVIDVLTRSLRSRDDLVELISIFFTEIIFDTLYDIGIIVKPISIGGASETEDRVDKLFRQTLTLDIRSEWRRLIPIGNLIETILFVAEFANLNVDPPIVAKNLTINTEVNLTDMIINL